MDFEKLAEVSHQAWFVAMAKQGWIFGPRLNADFKTHPWLKPYPGLSDSTKEIVRAQVRGLLAALEAQGVSSVKGLASAAPAPAPVATSSPRTLEPPARLVAAEAATPAARSATPVAVSAPVMAGETLERKIDASGRMRIGAGLVKKADLLAGGATQVAIVQTGDVIEVLPYDPGLANAFFASVNPDGFMLPKAMLSGIGASDFLLTITQGKLVVRPK